MRPFLSDYKFVRGAINSLPPFDPRLADSFALGSRNQLLLGLGQSKPWGGLLSKGANTGSRKMVQVGSQFGGLKDIGGLQGAGSLFLDIAKSLWFCGAGQVSIEGVNLTGITASTILSVSIAVAGSYSAGNTFAAGLPQPSALEVAILDAPGAGYEGITDGPVSFKVARLRLTTGARSIASATSAVLVPAKKSIRLTFPLASASQTHWRVFATQLGFGGVGLHYALKYGIGTAAVLDIPESVVAAGTAGGVARSLEFDYVTGDLVPELAYIDDYPPPAGTHAVRLENVMVVLGAFGDSSSAVSSTSTGTVGACSLPNFYESYKPTHRVYFPEQIVDHRARPTDSYCYVAGRNSITALQYAGLRDGPAVAVTSILPDIGIAKQQNWCQVGGLLYMRVANGGFLRMRDDGSVDYNWAAPIWNAVKSWDDNTVVGWHPDTMSVVIANGTEAWSYSLLNEEWSPVCYFADAGVAGTALSAVNSQGELIITINNAGTHTAYAWDKGAATMPITSMIPWTRKPANARSTSIRELELAFETDRVNANDPMVISIHRNQRQTFFRDGSVNAASNVITSLSSAFDDAHIGDTVCVFGPAIGPGGLNHLKGKISARTATTLTIVDPATGAPLNSGITATGLYALMGAQILVNPIDRVGGQHSEFLRKPYVFGAQSYAIGVNLMTNAVMGQVTEIAVRGNPSTSGTAKTT